MTDSIREHDPDREEAEWHVLHERITELLNHFGKKDAFGKGDNWLVDDNWGDYRHKLEFQNLDLFKPSIIQGLKDLLQGYPDWEITVRLDVIGKEKEWPGMGLIIHDDGNVDDLRREYLPEEFRNFRYEVKK